MVGAEVMMCGHHSILLDLSRWRDISLPVEVVSRVQVLSSGWICLGRSPCVGDVSITDWEV